MVKPFSRKPWFPYDRPDRPDSPSNFKKNLETIRTSTRVISGFHTIVSIASTTRDTTGDVSDVSGSDNRIFARVSQNKPNMMMQMMDFKRRANLEACYLSFLSILRRRQARRVPRRHSITWRTWLSLVSNSANTRCKHFCIIFSTSAASRPNLFSITGIVVMISGIAFDRPDRLSRLRAFPCDRFKIYTIIPIVRIELNSIQATEVVSVVRVVCDRPGSVST